MKTKLLIAIAFLCVGKTNAQQVKVNWGEESKVETAYQDMVRGSEQDLVKLSFETHGGGMFGGRQTVTPILTRYDKAMNEKAVRSFETDDKDVKFNSLLSVRGKLFIFTSRYNKDDKNTIYYAQKVNISSLNPEGKPVNLGSFDAINRTTQSSVGFELSKDSSRILMFGLSPYSKKGNEKYYIGVYNSDMAKEWEKTITLPYLDKFVDVLDKLVTNDGQVGVIIKHYDQEVKKESIRIDGAKVPAYKTKILLYTKEDETPKEYVLDLKDKYINGVQLTNDQNSNLVMFGLYRSKSDGYVNGYFITTIDRASKTVTVKKMEAFPESIISLVKTDKQGSDKESDPGFSGNFTLFDVMERGNGSTDYLIQYKLAVYHESTSTYGVGGRMSSTTSYWSYNYGDIIDINAKSDGSKTLFTRIPKMQTSVNTFAYSNFTSMIRGNKLILFYNDDPKNIERDTDKKPDGVTNFGNSAFTMATIDEKGNLNRTMVYSHKDMKLTTCVNECRKLTNDKIALYASKSGGWFSSSKDMIGTLELK